VPNPPERMTAPSKSFSIATSALATRLSIESGSPRNLMHPEFDSDSLLQIAQNFVQFSGGGEFLFERARPQIAPNLLQGLDHLIQHALQIVAVRENNITPDRIRAPRQPQRVAEASARQRDRQTRFVRLAADHSRERHSEKLRQVRDHSRGAVMRIGLQPDWLRAQFLDERDEFRDALFAFVGS